MLGRPQRTNAHIDKSSPQLFTTTTAFWTRTTVDFNWKLLITIIFMCSRQVETILKDHCLHRVPQLPFSSHRQRNQKSRATSDGHFRLTFRTPSMDQTTPFILDTTHSTTGEKPMTEQTNYLYQDVLRGISVLALVVTLFFFFVLISILSVLHI